MLKTTSWEEYERKHRTMIEPTNFTMNVLTGDKEIDDMLRKCMETFRDKGAEYTIGSKDRLHNFRTVANSIGLKMPQVWFTYFYKHFSSLSSYIKNDCTVKSNEPIESRIMDLIVYLLLFYKMTREIEEQRELYNDVAQDRADHG